MVGLLQKYESLQPTSANRFEIIFSNKHPMPILGLLMLGVPRIAISKRSLSVTLDIVFDVTYYLELYMQSYDYVVYTSSPFFFVNKGQIGCLDIII